MKAHSRLAKMKEFDELEIVRPLRSPNRGTLPDLIFSFFVLSYLILSYLILSYLILSYLILSCYNNYLMSGTVQYNMI